MPSSITELTTQLLALNTPEKPFRVTVEGNVVTSSWNLVDAQWLQLFAKAGMRETYSLVLTLNESTQSAQAVENMGKVEWTAGLPVASLNVEKFKGKVLFSLNKGYAAGIKSDLSVGEIYSYDFDVHKVKDPVMAVLQQAGWKIKDGPSSFFGKLLAWIGIGGAILAVLAVLFLAKYTKVTMTTTGVNDPKTDPTHLYASTLPMPKQPTHEVVSVKTLMITDSSIGQSIDANDHILNPSSFISERKGQVFVRAELDNAKVGDTIQTQVTYLKTGQVGLQKSFSIDKEGTTYLLLTYSSPAAGWLAGDYDVSLDTSSGQKKIVSFTVQPQ